MKRHTWILCLCLLASACGKKDDDVYTLGSDKSVKISEVISISKVSNATPLADTTDISLIEVSINPASDSANRIVTLSSSLGTFIGGTSTITLTADAGGKALAKLRSSTPGSATVTAKVKAASINTIINFVAAPPEDLLVTADNYKPDTSQTVTLTVNLFRNPGHGLPSDPVRIWLSVKPDLGSNSLVYPAFVNSASHQGTFVISNPFIARGAFKAEAKVLGARGDTLRRSITIVIK
ncbi:hypothetical protein PQ469_30775 [Mucilaginibacter sp. KACC 22773]|uniref:hypothetical protein n=1 Tax=Mucilaginibacter sp. KACC 22773 TaxID=3025671 RepID=UPI0023670299|nr:hypothetical protein [Mucilaginibacter sp. KACC 22773]WDF78274.1 hypothetical protein PQ469_30775 [Mucilaginibacter sp. KACC 22773]